MRRDFLDEQSGTALASRVGVLFEHCNADRSLLAPEDLQVIARARQCRGGRCNGEWIPTNPQNLQLNQRTTRSSAA